MVTPASEHGYDTPEPDPEAGGIEHAFRSVNAAAVNLEQATIAAVRPMLRGVNHLAAFPVSIITTLVLVWFASTPRAELAVAIFGTSVSLVLGMSAAYHNIRWPEGWARWARRADHAMIFLCMAGTYTSIWVGVLHGRAIPDALIWVAWAGALCGVTLKLVWIDAPKIWSALSYHLLGIAGLIAVPELLATAGATPTIMLLLSGLLFLLGGISYTLERPNPVPHVFGFHEVFHLLVTLGIAMQFATFAAYFLD